MRHGHWLLFTGLLVVGEGTVATAQERQIGLKAGASLATLERDRTQTGDEPYGGRTGMTAGPYAVLPVLDRLALQLEMLFTEKGGSLPLRDPSIVSGTITTRLRFHYMDVPALARVRGPRIKTTTLNAFAGPTLSVRLSARQQTVFTGEGAFGFERDLTEDMKRFDLALTVGAGAEIGSRMIMDARYTHGLNDVVADLAGARLSNRAFLITAGVRIF